MIALFWLLEEQQPDRLALGDALEATHRRKEAEGGEGAVGVSCFRRRAAHASLRRQHLAGRVAWH